MSKEGQLTDLEIKELLLQAPVGYMALARDNRPYVVPLNYVFSDEVIYFHCAPAGRKTDYIKVNPRACFHVSAIGELIKSDEPCSHNYSYHSVIVEGVVEEVCGNEAKEVALRKIVSKYAGQGMAKAPMPAKRIDSVGVYRLIPDSISAKKDS